MRLPGSYNHFRQSGKFSVYRESLSPNHLRKFDALGPLLVDDVSR